MRQVGWQFLRIEIGGGENESVMVWGGIGRCAWAGIELYALRAFATDVFVRRLAHRTFGKSGNRGRNAVGDPVKDAGAAAALGIDHEQNEAFGAIGYVGPGELRRDVVADAVRIVRRVSPAVSDLFRHYFAVVECLRLQREDSRPVGGGARETKR